jgi:Protein of unknown function (DUF3631)/Bifunctional DNA primase/polymerase, N-terminal/Primase C terminal 1 (PriCT-1)
LTREEARKWAGLYLTHGFAVTWTDGKEGDAAKRVTRKRWNETPPLAGELDSIAGQFADRIQRANPAVVAKTSGLVLVDIDDQEGLDTFRKLGLPETMAVVSSGAHKCHLYYKAPAGARYFCFEFAGGSVTAKENAYLVAPPATHPSGATYQFVNGIAPVEVDIAVLERAAGAAKRAEKARLVEPEAKVTKGQRHAQLISTAGVCRAKGLGRESALDVVQRFNAEKCEPPYPKADVEAKVRDVYQRYEAPPSPEPVEWGGNLAALLDDVRRNILRFIVVGAPESYALALWAAHTHAFDAAEVTPYIEIRSAEKRCGKSTLLRVLESLVARPRLSANMSDAVLYRLVQAERPTLLWDEVDAVFGAKAKDREDTRQLLNAGFENGATAWRMGGANNTEFEEFAVFCPKVFASIGKLPDTLTDRAITIHMLRKHRGEKTERARRGAVRAAGAELRAALGAWAENTVDDLATAEPDLPEQLNDREQDYWEPLLAIADIAGERWAKAARRAAVELSAIAGEDVGLLEELLAGIFRAFESVNGNPLSTVDLITLLCADEEAPWRGEWWDERESQPTGEAPRKLARMLRPVGIRSANVRTDAGRHKGYRAEFFEDAWARYEICVPSVPSAKTAVETQQTSQIAGTDGIRTGGEAVRMRYGGYPYQKTQETSQKTAPGTGNTHGTDSEDPPDLGTAPMDVIRRHYEDAE